MHHKIYTAITILSLTVAAGCNQSQTDKKVSEQKVENTIETFTLQPQSISSEIVLPAELSGYQQVDIYAKVSGYVKSLKVDIGSEVKKGQLLIELEAPEMISQLAAAQSQLHSKEAIYIASNNTYQRYLETSKVEGTISKNDLELGLARKNSDFAQLEAARASIREIQVMQNYLQIRAPFNGKVTLRNINIGAYVAPGSPTPLLVIQDNQKLRLSVSVPEAYSGYLKISDELTFKVVSIKGENFKAKISRMSGALDPKFRSEKVELDVINKNGPLLPGMIAEVSLPLKSKIEPFSVTKSAVMNTTEGIFVIKVDNKKVQRIKVETGLQAGDRVEIFSDLLHKNDTLLIKASEELKDGVLLTDNLSLKN